MPQRPPSSSPPSSTGAPTGSTPGLEAAFRQAWAGVEGPGQDAAAATAQGVFVAIFVLDAWRPWLDAMRGLLDRPESERVARKRRSRDADDLALAYGLHRLVLGRVTGCEPRAVPLARDVLGRPCLLDDTVQTSLSHAEGAVAIAVARHGPVGIDIEAMVRAAQMDEIADAVLHPSERAAVAALSAPDRARTLLALWVRKEALLKAAGIGLAREMHGFLAPEATPVPLPAIDGPGGADVVVRMVEAGLGWMAAVAARPDARIVTAWLSPPRWAG